MALIIVLADGETYTEAAGCRLIEIDDDYFSADWQGADPDILIKEAVFYDNQHHANLMDGIKVLARFE